MVTVRYEPWRCASCNHEMDSASHPLDDEAVPSEGDVSVCLRCGYPHLLKQGQWVGITDNELISLSLEEKRAVSYMQLMVREFNKRKDGR
jgi:NMD protein affecting ribosome stability and mRNA decay